MQSIKNESNAYGLLSRSIGYLDMLRSISLWCYLPDRVEHEKEIVERWSNNPSQEIIDNCTFLFASRILPAAMRHKGEYGPLLDHLEGVSSSNEAYRVLMVYQRNLPSSLPYHIKASLWHLAADRPDIYSFSNFISHIVYTTGQVGILSRCVSILHAEPDAEPLENFLARQGL